MSEDKMSKFMAVCKETFELSDADKKMPFDECIKMMIELKKANSEAIFGEMKDSVTRKNTYLGGIKDKCIQFEVIFEMEIEEDFLSEQISTPNPIIEKLELIKENIGYNKIVNSSTLIKIDPDSRKVFYEKDGKTFGFRLESIQLNGNKKYFEALTNFCSIAQSVDGLHFKRNVDQKPDLDFSLNHDEFREIAGLPDVEKKTDLIENKELKEVEVRLIRTVLVKDKRLKWRISFDPDLSGSLVVDRTKEYEAYVKDDKYIAWITSDSFPGFKNGDSFICDVNYSIQYKDGDVFATIKNVELNNIKNGEKHDT